MKKLTRLYSFAGRVKRAKFLQFIPLALGLWLLAAWVDETWLAPNLCLINENWICYLPGEVREGITLDMAVFAFAALPFLALSARRVHDHDRSGWWALLGLPLLIVLAGFLYFPEWGVGYTHMAAAAVIFLPLLYWILRKGPKEPNRYG